MAKGYSELRTFISQGVLKIVFFKRYNLKI